MQFSTAQSLEFHLDQYDTPEEWENAILNMKHLGGQTWTSKFSYTYSWSQ